jgi:hypothetical protein
MPKRKSVTSTSDVPPDPKTALRRAIAGLEVAQAYVDDHHLELDFTDGLEELRGMLDDEPGDKEEDDDKDETSEDEEDEEDDEDE